MSETSSLSMSWQDRVRLALRLGVVLVARWCEAVSTSRPVPRAVRLPRWKPVARPQNARSQCP